jgi:amino acid transporter
MMGVLAVFMIAGLLALHAGKGHGALTLHAFFNPQTFTWKAMGAAVLISSVNYLGFDATTTLGEEVEETGHKPMGKACLLTLGLMALMSVGQAWVAQDLTPGATIVSADTAFYDVSRYIGGDWLYSLTSISTALGYGIACSIVGQAAISRILFAMGRDGLLLQAFAKVHPKTHQPYVANLFVGAVSLVVALGFANHLDEIVLFQNFGALTAFTFVNLAVIGYFWVKHKSGRTVRHLLIPACGIVMITFLLSSMRSATLTLGAIWISLGLLYYLVITRVFGRRAALEV